MPSVSLRDLSVLAGRTQLISGISADLMEGVTAVLGRNGAGKSTLLRVLAGILRPTSGVLTVDGEQIFSSGTAMRRFHSSLGHVPQNPGFPGGMRTRDYLAYVAWLRMVPSLSIDAALERSAAATGVTTLLGRRLRTLSGGERQRVILAGALIGEPAVILLDEPTAGLDPAQRRSYLSLVRSMAGSRTIVLATHIIDDVIEAADTVLILDAGTAKAHLSLDNLELAGSNSVSQRLTELVLMTRDRNA